MARPDETTAPVGAVNDAFSPYGVIVWVGVFNRELGSVVATVAEKEEKKEDKEAVAFVVFKA